jgi:predicted Zn-dependent protease
VAQQRLAELAAGFPTSAGRDVIACELARLDKHLDQADTSCRAALTKDPGAVRAHVALGRMALQAGRKAEAEKHLHHAKMLDPMDRDVWQALGQVYRALGDKSKRSRLASEHEVVFHAPLPP